MAAAVVGGALVALALPIRALGGASAISSSTTLTGSTAGHAVIYTVRPGDTLWSIATRLDPSGDPRPLVADMTAETGSATVVPGERIRLP